MPDVYANSAQFTRFEREQHCVFPGQRKPELPEYLVPVHYIREWQSPRNGGESVFKTVRISEHKWPMSETFRCRGPGADSVEWPAPPPAISRILLCAKGLIVPWNFWPFHGGESPLLELDDPAWDRHDRGYSGPNDGLPADYLDFWLGTAEESERSDD